MPTGWAADWQAHVSRALDAESDRKSADLDWPANHSGSAISEDRLREGDAVVVNEDKAIESQAMGQQLLCLGLRLALQIIELQSWEAAQHAWNH